MTKRGVFISHITEEAPVARILKASLDTKFLGAFDVFASSHEESIELGSNWFDSIRNSIQKCDAVIVICSPISVGRPWINFEAGAGWAREIPVIPLCHSGLTPGKLPVPLNSLQAGMMSNRKDIKNLFSRLAGLADLNIPDSDDERFFEKIQSFENSVQKNRFISDTSFITTLIGPDLGALIYLIIASATKIQDMGQAVANWTTDDEINFNDIENLFNVVPLINRAGMPRVYSMLAETITKVSDSIKFIISNNRIELAPDIFELLKDFLFIEAHMMPKWSHGIQKYDDTSKHPIFHGAGMASTNQEPAPGHANMVARMIRDEPLPPKRKPSNSINIFIDYYETLNKVKKWISSYSEVMAQHIASPAV
jgi:hypothetical protein